MFSQDKDSMPRVWTGKEDVRKITKNARAEVPSFFSGSYPFAISFELSISV